ncbi:MAG TPA: GYD domain-containing protein [Candidatus Eisenbacteria bacterium]|nr:GYD domain-containing protein [Candidatus Eisenbacteria bacterium]
MPHYIAMLSYTAQGIAKVKDSPSRLDAARKAAESMGGKLHSWYLTMGHIDAVIIAEFPSDEVCAKFMLSVSSLGNVTTKTLKAFSEDEYRKIIASLP